MRESVKLFADEMENILKQNDHKLHWSFFSEHSLFLKLQIEMNELKEAIGYLDLEKSLIHEDKVKEAIKKECIDVANFAMMLWDNLEKNEVK